jgi:NitT/TauT family transport system ATP-binding protein
MSPRPGRVREVLDVDIPRPRDPGKARADERAIKLRAHVWERLRRDAEAEAAPA